MFKRFLSDKLVEWRYVALGVTFGDMVSYIYMGECAGFDRQLDKWAGWEKEYARRGFRTIALDDLVEAGGYGVPLPGLGVKRGEGEKAVLHAEIYRERFLGMIAPAIDLKKLVGQNAKTQTGTYELPSTKDL